MARRCTGKAIGWAGKGLIPAWNGRLRSALPVQPQSDLPRAVRAACGRRLRNPFTPDDPCAAALPRIGLLADPVRGRLNMQVRHEDTERYTPPRGKPKGSGLIGKKGAALKTGIVKR